MSDDSLLLAFRRLKISRVESTLWIERADGTPLSQDELEIVGCVFLDPELAAGDGSFALAVGSREYLGGVDAILKLVTAPFGTGGTAFMGRSERASTVEDDE